ncbi:MAG TPA: RNA-binding S4 domain-containing protein [Stellaceae bacterium]|nr:RNA-binding S4 domain-containing protein [Stellaceae bacterium]
MKNELAPLPTLRLDKWLWFARLAKTRSLAARLCSEGCVAIGTRDAAKPHHAVKIGDIVVVELPHERRRLIVRALGQRRGSAAEARLLYDEPTPPVRHEARAAGWTSLFAEDGAVVES